MIEYRKGRPEEMPDILDFARKYPDYTAFYNGPASGASAPDHLHFQAAPRHKMPLEEAVDAFLDAPGAPSPPSRTRPCTASPATAAASTPSRPRPRSR